MAKVMVTESYLEDIADAIRAKKGVETTYKPGEMATAISSISSSPILQSKTYTVDSAGTATVTADSGYDGLSSVAVSVPSAGLVGGNFPGEITVTIDNDGLIYARVYDLQVVNPAYESGWITTTDEMYIAADYQGGLQLSTQSATAITPTESSQTAVSAGKYTTGAVTVNAIPSNYVGSGITRRSSSDLTASGATVTVPSGYYSAQASKAVASGTAGTPTATKGTVSNHSISVTPSVTNTSGYITGSTKTGTAVTVSASELASGNKAITENGTGIDVVGYSTVSVNVPNNDVWKPIQAQTRTIIEDPNGNYLWYDGTSPDFAEGQTWRVTWGNETYIVQTKYGALSGGTGWFLGNPGAVGEADDGSGYTWFAWNQNSGAIAIGTSETGSKKVILELQQSNPYQVKTVTYTPSETQQTATVVPDSGYNGLSTVGVTVNAISSTYVGSEIARKSSTDLTVSGATVTAPAGYYSAAASKSVATMTLPTSAASSATSGYTSKATIGRSTAAQYINIPPGYNSTGAYYVISAVANGSATAPASISGTAANVSTGTNTLTLTKTVSVTPTVTAGYVSSGTAGNSSVSLTASVTTKAAATITPTTTNQTIAAGTYLTGAQTIAGDADLVGSNILSTANIFGVQGTVVVQNCYTGSSAPSSSLGSNGDLYLQA